METGAGKNYEKKGSLIQWERIDPQTEENLAAAIYKDSRKWAIQVLVFSIFIFVILFSISGFLLEIFWDGDDLPLVTIIPFAAVLLFFACIVGKQLFKSLPYLFPEKHAGIWIFHTVCMDTSTMRDDGNSETHFAHFEKNGERIRIKLLSAEYRSIGPGASNEFIFYKFNDKTGDPWRALCLDLLRSRGQVI